MVPQSLSVERSWDRLAPAFARLTRRAEFQRVARGRRKQARAFTLQWASRDAADAAPPQPRIGFTASKKVGNAVVRNRIRRRLKEALRAAAPLEARPECDYVLIARREALSRPFADLIDDMRDSFRATVRGDASPRPPAGTTRGKDPSQ